MPHKIVSRLLSFSIIGLVLLYLTGCSGLAGVASDAALGALSPDKQGIELTAQVGKENNKGLMNTKVEFADEIELDDISGDANVNSGNVTNNKTSSMVMLVLAGMVPPLLFLFYFLPAPKWIRERHA